ncbi:ABC transporter substrate-binding protein [Thalassobaculum sp. OXR-137]|uniref:MlaC/ttg2D family ABC transporter substrate-binding protein n=1 Tax=Thalassobaculum sp. OXR-137 TaxID=3100173 RepID=UPI002AC8AAF4|nr:ABC transporter substrate-binding protein [Thalassobaculum sp. OXR-137]WPZ36571.1 ABC transporter substrate-binding protein [Thalassobaculum sp. OXR-137]
MTQARAASDAGAFVGEFAEKAIALVSESNLSTAERRDEFGDLVRTYFDMPGIGRFLLGRYWRTATEAEQEAYLKAFTDNMVYTYSRRFDEYGGQKLVIDGTREDGRFDIVSSRIVSPSSSEEFRLEWRVIEDGSSFKIVDIVIEGVSMSVTQRQEYASVIQNNGGKVQALIDALTRQMAGVRSSGG